MEVSVDPSKWSAPGEPNDFLGADDECGAFGAAQEGVVVSHSPRTMAPSSSKFEPSAVEYPGNYEWVYKETETRIVNHYQIEEVIGEGEYGTVHVAQDLQTGAHVAVKVMDKKKLRRFKLGESNVYSEIECLNELDHVNIVKMLDLFDTPDGEEMFIVFELLRGGSLDLLLRNAPAHRFSEGEAWHYFRQLMEGVRYMHCARIVHRDIKPANLILSLGRVVKLADFGVAQRLESRDGHCSSGHWTGSPALFPPEVASGKETLSGFKADVWGCGITLYMMVCGAPPFSGDSVEHLLDNIAEAKFDIPDHLSEDLQSLLRGMLHPDESLRLSVEDILAHSWVTTEKEVVYTPISVSEVDIDTRRASFNKEEVDGTDTDAERQRKSCVIL